jgi:hypothetical protein
MCRKPERLDPLADDVIDHGLRSSLRQICIVLIRAFVVGVTRDLDLNVAVLLEKINNLVQLNVGFLFQGSFVKIEIDVF